MPATLTVLYPVEPSEFDHAFYAAEHLPRVIALLRDVGLEDASVSRGVAGAASSAPSPFHAAETFIFPDSDALQAALGKADAMMSDMPRYYRGQPVLMVGDRLV